VYDRTYASAGERGNVTEATSGERFADADPEYAFDGADDIDAEAIEVERRDPKNRTEDKGDIGSAEPGMESR
jgi:hypothetical protein